MPELPEVETVRRGLQPVLEGRRIAAVAVRRPDLRVALPADLARRIEGRRVQAVRRRAKFLLIDLAGGDTLIAHLGMSGRLRVFEKDRAPPLEPHDHVEIATDGGRLIRFNDARRFGLIGLVPTEALDVHPWLARLGPEPLDESFDGMALAARLAGRKSAIKAALMDQRVVAGLGNIYCSEALFRAGISPRRRAGTVHGERAERLARAIRDVLTEAISAGGSSLRDHRQPSGELGYFQHRFAVYDREGLPCATCGTGRGKSERRGAGLIRRIVQGQRATFFCPRCQR